MKNYFLVLFCFTCYSCMCNKKLHCSGHALLIPKQQPVNVYDKPGGQIITTIMDDIDTDFFNMFVIKKIKKNYALAEIYPGDQPNLRGWISTEFIGIRPSIYWGELKLYVKPDKNSKISSIICDPYWQYYSVKKCYKKWFYIEHKSEGQVYEGWMSPDTQCSNPYSPCN